MPLTIDNAGALIPGVILKQEGNVATIKVKVLRGFFDGKTALKPGDIVTLSVSLAHQAKDAHKVEFLPEEPKIEVPKAKEKPIAPVSEEEKPDEVKSEEKSKKYGKY